MLWNSNDIEKGTQSNWLCAHYEEHKMHCMQSLMFWFLFSLLSYFISNIAQASKIWPILLKWQVVHYAVLFSCFNSRFLLNNNALGMTLIYFYNNINGNSIKWINMNYQMDSKSKQSISFKGVTYNINAAWDTSDSHGWGEKPALVHLSLTMWKEI